VGEGWGECFGEKAWGGRPWWKAWGEGRGLRGKIWGKALVEGFGGEAFGGKAVEEGSGAACPLQMLCEHL